LISFFTFQISICRTDCQRHCGASFEFHARRTFFSASLALGSLILKGCAKTKALEDGSCLTPPHEEKSRRSLFECSRTLVFET
jgi:hypothetical protein